MPASLVSIRCRFLVALFFSTAISTLAADWQAGVGRQIITPPQPMRMSGYAGRNDPAEKKLHDLWAKGLAIQDPSGARLLLITMDLVGIDKDLSDSVCKTISDKHKLPRESIALNVSHTHTGPIVGRNLRSMYDLSDKEKEQINVYASFLQSQLGKVADEALSSLKPATISWGTGRTTFAVNRRDNLERNIPVLTESGALRGTFDHDVPVLKVAAPDGALKAVVFGYACHCTVLNFVQWSGDYAGCAQADLEKSHPGTTAMFFAGCGADQNPLPRRSVELAEKYGQMLADAVDETLKAELKPLNGNCSAHFSTLDLPYEKLPTQEDLDTMIGGKDANKARYGKYLAAELKEKGKFSESYPYPIQIWQLGKDLTFVALGGEVVVDYSLRLKREMNPGHTWVAGYCNDIMAYIPSKRVWKEGGYEGRDSMMFYGLPSAWAENAEELIIAKVHSIAGTKARQRSLLYKDKLNLLTVAGDDNESHPVKTAADWEKRRTHVLSAMQDVMGPLPTASRKVDPDMKVEEEAEVSGCVRKKISFAVEKGDRIKAYLFIPKAPQGKKPAMLCLHQTTGIAKAEPAGLGGKPNLHYALELAQRGYVTLAPDYPYFGENKTDPYALGYESATMKGIWNHMRAVDLLQSLPEVDPERIGVIGHSLGGHNTLFVAAFDQRLKVAVTSCGFTSFPKYYGGKTLINWAPKKYMPRITCEFDNDPAKMPFDFSEVLGAIAPRAIFINAPEKDDNFEISGVKDCVNAAKPIFELLGVPDKLVAVHPNSAHDFPPEARQQAYQFIDKVFDKK